MKNYLLILALIAAMPSFAQDTSNAQADILKRFATELLHKKAPAGGHATAVSIAVQCKQNLPMYVAVGTNGFQDKTPVSKNSIFPIGSITKSFISVVILQLAQEMGFSLDDTTLIAKYFPEYPKWGNITLRQLLNMKSGIPGNSNDLADDIFLKFSAEEYKNYVSPKKLLDLEYKLPMHFKPGEKFEYANTNYILLGQFIKKITNHDPEDEVTQRIFKKINMNHSYFPKDKLYMVPGIDKSAIVKTYSFYPPEGFKQYPFIHEGEEVSNWSMSEINMGGAIASTPEDINIYVHALYNPGPLLNSLQIKELTKTVSKLTGKPILMKKGIKELGFGFSVVAYYWPKVNHVIYMFNGSTNGGTFNYMYDPISQLYLSSAVNVNPSADILTFDNTLALFADLTDLCK
ncbi:MAG: D-alanyl-D-alanine carboxypeptidase [Burkholderiales bacterium]|jgi:D-alanyl-D-alanine carboxypeptidase|nr:D-alanyl-D-alanine carboxypeptidase [Burkholderiales bacterium]